MDSAAPEWLAWLVRSGRGRHHRGAGNRSACGGRAHRDFRIMVWHSATSEPDLTSHQRCAGPSGGDSRRDEQRDLRRWRNGFGADARNLHRLGFHPLAPTRLASARYLGNAAAGDSWCDSGVRIFGHGHGHSIATRAV